MVDVIPEEAIHEQEFGNVIGWIMIYRRNGIDILNHNLKSSK